MAILAMIKLLVQRDLFVLPHNQAINFAFNLVVPLLQLIPPVLPEVNAPQEINVFIMPPVPEPPVARSAFLSIATLEFALMVEDVPMFKGLAKSVSA